MADDEQGDVQIRFNFNNLHTHFSYKIQRIFERATIALEGVAKLTEPPSAVPGVSLPYTNVKMQLRSLDESRPDVSAWIVACAVRDWLEEVHAFLERTRALCAAVSLADAGTPVTRERLTECVEQPAPAFDRLSFPKKLKFLEDSYGDIIGDQVESVLSLVNARNCIVHRLGVVGDRDVTPGSKDLVVRWQSMRLWAQNPGEAEPFIATPERNRVEAGGAMFMRSVEIVRHYSLGERVTLEPRDLCDIWMTLRDFAGRTAMKVWEYAQTKGFTSNEPFKRPEPVGTLHLGEVEP